MSGAALAAPHAPVLEPPSAGGPPTRDTAAKVRALLARPVVASFLLLLLYAALSTAVSPGGFVAADTGGKVATLRVMDRNGTLDPDVGYWAAAYDPNGLVHPLRTTARIGDGWVQVTTLPMVVAALPLHALGGDRLILLLPMLGGVLTALAARALARRTGAGSGWTAFWVVGLASPVALYALSFWEHTLGLAAMAWAMVLVLDVARARAGIGGAAVAGVLFGVAATMRTEALVYCAVAAVCMCGATLLRDRRVGRAVAVGAAALAGAAVALLGEYALEVVLVGHGLRGARATATAAGAGASLAGRLQDAATTFVGLDGFADPFDWIVGALVVTLLVAGTWCLVRNEERRRLGRVLVGLAALFALLRVGAGLGFVPGLLTASPVAAVGAFAIWSRTSPRVLAVTAWLALPLVWITQYTDGARPQWGGRYLLLSGVLFAVAAVVALERHRAALSVVVACSVAVTAFGFAFLTSRSDTVASGFAEILATRPRAIISLDPHLFREAGASFDPAAHWLTATDGRELTQAARVMRESGTRSFVVLVPVGTPRPHLAGYERSRTERTVEVRPDLRVEVVSYHSP